MFTPPTVFAMVLDGDETLRAIDRAGSPSGQPTEEIVITSIEVTESGPVD